jgi:carboxyl-terminal processing protease
MRAPLFVLGVLFVLCGGIWLGGHPETLPEPLRKAFVDEGPAVRAELIQTIQDNYYKPVKKSALEDASLKGMAASLRDPYTRYFTPKEAKRFDEDLAGRFEGVGMTVAPRKAGLAITEVFPGSPAKEAGLRPADLITRVDGKSIAGLSVNESTSRIKGPPGTFVNLTVRRGKQTKKFRVKRAKIVVPAVKSKIVNSGGVKLGVANMQTSFSNGVHGILRTHVDKLIDKGAKGIVLDLRGNPGGLLREAVLVSSIFVEDGKIASTRGRASPERVYKAQGDAIAKDVPVVVLVDGFSASASEIVTGALRDTGRAKVVGTKTFGKGVFQEIESLDNGGAIDLTIGRYYLPKGEPLPKGGIKADIRAKDDPKTKRDEALPVALHTLARDLK